MKVTTTDVWGLGATLYEAATGVAPFAPQNSEEEERFANAEYLQLRRPAPSPTALGRRLPRAFSQLLTGCLEVEPSSRPDVLTVHEVLGDMVVSSDE